MELTTWMIQWVENKWLESRVGDGSTIKGYLEVGFMGVVFPEAQITKGLASEKSEWTKGLVYP